MEIDTHFPMDVILPTDFEFCCGSNENVIVDYHWDLLKSDWAKIMMLKQSKKISKNIKFFAKLKLTYFCT